MLVGVGRFELPISCSQSRRLAARPHPETRPETNGLEQLKQVPPRRLELRSLAPEASTLSTELRGQLLF